jgi:hypothetical protein
LTRIQESLVNNVCDEIGSTGVFVWLFADLTNIPLSYTSYLYIMTNQLGDIRRETQTFGGWPDNTGTEPLVPANTCKIKLKISRPNDTSGINPSVLYRNDETYAHIIDRHYSNNYYYPNTREFPSTNKLTRESFWIFPQGSTIRIVIKSIGVNQTVTVPNQTEVDLNTLLGI